MTEENVQTTLKITSGMVKKHCFLCAIARYLTAFVFGVIVGLIWSNL